MLRLWPDHLTLGVFPSGCWLQAARQHKGAALEIELPAAGLDPLDAIDALLEKRDGQFVQKARADVLVSDMIGVSTALPWQDNLGSPSLVQSYARMLLESQGRLDGSAWTIAGGFRHFGSAGLGAALPDSWLMRLDSILDKHGLRLRSALPMSAAAYWQFNKLTSRRSCLLLLDEGSRALRYSGRKLLALDAQPVLNGLGDNAERLCRRLLALHGAVDEVWIWSLKPDAALAQAVSRCMPDVKINALTLGHWRRA